MNNADAWMLMVRKGYVVYPQRDAPEFESLIYEGTCRPPPSGSPRATIGLWSLGKESAGTSLKILRSVGKNRQATSSWFFLGNTCIDQVAKSLPTMTSCMASSTATMESCNKVARIAQMHRDVCRYYRYYDDGFRVCLSLR